MKHLIEKFMLKVIVKTKIVKELVLVVTIYIWVFDGEIDKIILLERVIDVQHLKTNM